MKSKVLIIEDEFEILDSMSILLEYEGYEVVAAENGEIGIEKAQQENPDLILCDILMPGIDGYEVLKKIKSIPELAYTAFIFLTANISKAERRKGMALGADDYITKPCPNDFILQAIESTIAKHNDIKENYEKVVEDFQADIAATLPKELLNPIKSIIGFAKMIESNCEQLNSDDIRMMSGNISNQSHRLLHLISNYTYYIKLFDTNDSESNKDFTVNSKSIVVDFANDIANSYGRISDLIIEFEEAALQLSEEHLIKVVKEIIDNAFKFSKNGNKVIIKGSENDESYNLIIENQGSSLKEDQIKSIAPFRKFDDIPENIGSGLGLAISKKILNVNSGKLTIQSNGSRSIKIILDIPKRDNYYSF